MRYSYEYKAISIDLIQEWTPFFKPKEYNWLDFHVADIHFENSVHTGTAEVELIIMGLGIRIYWTYNEKKLKGLIDSWNIEIEKKGN